MIRPVLRLHHVQVACPPGGEDAVRRFYGEGLGLVEVEKPQPLRDRGGAWFRSWSDGSPGNPDHEGGHGVQHVTAELHVGVEDPFVPARKAHPAFALDGPGVLATTTERLRALGYDVDEGERDTLSGSVRAHVTDPHGNRVELLAPTR